MRIKPYINLNTVYQRFLSGESLRSISKEFDVHYTTLSARLKKNGFYVYKIYKSGKEHPSWKGSTFVGQCVKCGNDFVGVKRKTEKKHCMTQRFCSLKCSQSREFNPRWRGGFISPLRALRSSSQYKTWMKSVKQRDGECVICGSQDRLEADHIKPFSLFPELRFAIDNGRTLCHECHKKTHTYAGRTLSMLTKQAI